MNFLRIALNKINGFWNKLSLLQKCIIIGVFLLGITGIILALIVPSSKMIPIFEQPIKDDDVLDAIIYRINQEGYRVLVTSQGRIMVDNEATARQIRSIIMIENLIHSTDDTWTNYTKEKWADPDSETNETLEKNILSFLKEYKNYIGILLIIIGATIILYTVFIIIYGENFGKILASVVIILLGIIFMLPYK